jgi:hypothetical protein
MSQITHSHDAAHELPDACPNCDAPVHGPYCAQCGQETVHEMPTLREFAHEYLHHYVAAEGKLVPTVRMLLLKPGQLTIEYLQGRRRRYVKPLSLYVTFSFVFFLLLGWTTVMTPTPAVVTLDDNRTVPATQVFSTLAASETDPNEKAVLRFLDRHMNWVFQPGKLAAFNDHVLHRLPYTVFVLMPVFAAMCGYVYRKRRQNYGMHLLFTVHLHAFIFLVFLLCLIPGVRNFGGWVMLVVLIYLILALKRVYGGRWLPQVARGVLLWTGYGVVTGLALTVLAFVSTDLWHAS